MVNYQDKPYLHKNKLVFLDSSMEFNAFLGLENILDSCKVEKGKIWETSKGIFTRDRPFFSSIDGYVFTVKISENGYENIFFSENNINLMKKNYGNKLIDRNVFCYNLIDSFSKGENNSEKILYGISFDILKK